MWHIQKFVVIRRLVCISILASCNYEVYSRHKKEYDAVFFRGRRGNSRDAFRSGTDSRDAGKDERKKRLRDGSSGLRRSEKAKQSMTRTFKGRRRGTASPRISGKKQTGER